MPVRSAVMRWQKPRSTAGALLRPRISVAPSRNRPAGSRFGLCSVRECSQRELLGAPSVLKFQSCFAVQTANRSVTLGHYLIGRQNFFPNAMDIYLELHLGPGSKNEI